MSQCLSFAGRYAEVIFAVGLLGGSNNHGRDSADRNTTDRNHRSRHNRGGDNNHSSGSDRPSWSRLPERERDRLTPNRGADSGRGSAFRSGGASHGTARGSRGSGGGFVGWFDRLMSRRNGRRTFYATIAVTTLAGAALTSVAIDPVRALYWAAVVNGVLAAPLMVMMMLIVRNQRAMGRLTLSPAATALGWAATLVMAAATVLFFAFMLG